MGLPLPLPRLFDAPLLYPMLLSLPPKRSRPRTNSTVALGMGLVPVRMLGPPRAVPLVAVSRVRVVLGVSSLPSRTVSLLL